MAGADSDCTYEAECTNEYNSADEIFYRTWWNLTEVPEDIPAEAEEVHLQGNKITSLPAGVFSNLLHCSKLNLERNTMETLADESFAGLHSLTVLHLAGNRISSLPGGVFTPLVEIYRIDLSRNKIASVNKEAFRDMKHLASLSLNDNKFLTIDAEAFDGLKITYCLQLMSNKMSSLNRGSFRGLKELHRLHLSGNKLTILRQGFFEGLDNLAELSLDYNRISVIEPGTFDDLVYNQGVSIQLYGNKLTTLSPDLFINIPRPTTLWLSRGRWNCSSLCWLKHKEELGTLNLQLDFYFPECTGNVHWSALECGDPGRYIYLRVIFLWCVYSKKGPTQHCNFFHSCTKIQ